MRVTSNSPYRPFHNHLNTIQENKYKNEIRLESGKKNISLSDNPKDIYDAKQFTEMMERNKSYIENIQETYSELQMTSNMIDHIADKMTIIQDTAVYSMSPANANTLHSLANVVKNNIEDILASANNSHNNKFLFSGNITTSQALQAVNGNDQRLPFSLDKVAPTPNNPSGLVVRFHGNFQERLINRDSVSTEVVNTTADKLFGNNGVQYLNEMIEIYNTLAYDENGQLRDESSRFTPAETTKLSRAIETLAGNHERVVKTNSIIGAKVNRILAVNEQLVEENTRIKNMRSLVEDTNYAETMMDLVKNQTALDYALKVGSMIQSKSLIDFLG